MLIDRQPPSMDEMARRLTARIARDGRRPINETIPPDPIRSARSRAPLPSASPAKTTTGMEPHKRPLHA